MNSIFMNILCRLYRNVDLLKLISLNDVLGLTNLIHKVKLVKWQRKQQLVADAVPVWLSGRHCRTICLVLKIADAEFHNPRNSSIALCILRFSFSLFLVFKPAE